MGELVRVLPGLFIERPTDFAALSQQKELYFVFYTLVSALRDHQAEIVSHQSVPKWARQYPQMRWCGARDQNGKAIAWKIFNASSSLSVEEHQRTPLIRNLTSEQNRLSIHQLWPHPVLVKQLARGWTPDIAEQLRLQDVAEADKRRTKSVPENTISDNIMKHYLYFSEKPNAEEVAGRLRSLGYSVEVRKGAEGEDWLALVSKAQPDTGEQMDDLRNLMETLSAQFGGEYDGWEVAIDSLGSRNAKQGRKVN